ncbi:hypothetical protein ACQ4LE_005826 [Meloidogyne hapla]
MESLLYGQIIDTLKCLDFNQLFALKQTNKYFKTLIGRYEHLLARKEFHCIFIANCNKSLKMIDLKSGLFYFQVTSQLEKKWQLAIDRKIPIHLNVVETPPKEDETVIFLDNEVNEDYYDKTYILKLPLFPKNFEDLKIIYCWLFNLSHCGFAEAIFIRFIFNPEFLQLIFEENFQLRIHSKEVFLNYFNPNSENVLKFNLERLLIVERLLLNFANIDNTNEYNDVLLKLVLNGGYVISEILLHQLKQLTLYNLTINLIETSKDCSKMVANLLFNFDNCPRINLSIRTKEIEREEDGNRNFVSYVLSNIYNPNVRFYVMNVEDDGKCILLELNELLKQINLKLFALN